MYILIIIPDYGVTNTVVSYYVFFISSIWLLSDLSRR